MKFVQQYRRNLTRAKRDSKLEQVCLFYTCIVLYFEIRIVITNSFTDRRQFWLGNQLKQLANIHTVLKIWRGYELKSR
jgi:hypothetical protein